MEPFRFSAGLCGTVGVCRLCGRPLPFQRQHGRRDPIRRFAISLVLQNIDVRLDGVAYLNDVSLEFKRGGLYTVLGRTLAGKTTLLRTIAGLQDPQKGTLTLHGQDYLRLPVWKRNVAMVYQQFINYPHLNVLDNVAFPLRRTGLSCKEARRRAGEVLAKMGLANFENRRPSSMSGGQQQRVALARALVKRADILLLDEPLVGLTTSCVSSCGMSFKIFSKARTMRSWLTRRQSRPRLFNSAIT